MESASSHRTRKRQRSLKRCSRATRFLSTGVQGRPRLRISCPRATTLADRLQVAPPPSYRAMTLVRVGCVTGEAVVTSKEHLDMA